MKNITAKKHLEYKIASNRKLPPNEILSEMFVEAILYVANKCVPNELLRLKSTERVYRNIENGFFIAYPQKPDFENEKEHLQIDESLTFAVINYVAYMISENLAYKAECNEIIGEYNANDGKELA